jgi:integrase
MKLKLDARSVTSLKLDEGKAEEFFWDVDLSGFGLRVRRRRHDGMILRSWTAQYRARADGRTRRHALGSASKVPITAAREAARKILAGAALGHDPAGEKRAKRARARRTFSSSVDAYLAAAAERLRPNSLRLGELFLRGGDYFAPLFGIPIDEITRADVAACLTSAARRHSSNAAASARRWCSTLFAWAVMEGWLENNPTIGTRRPQRAPARERVLSDAELAAVWRSCDGDDDFSKIVRLLILTGARRTEVGGMCWSELDHTLTGDGGLPVPVSIWTLPAARSKNHRAHAITLPQAALEIINSTPRRACDQLFGSLWAPHRGFTTWGRAKAELDARLGFEHPWRLHDLRRTAATGMADIGIEPHVIEATLNHQSFRSGIASTYNKSKYTAPIAAALARWAVHVAALVEGRAAGNVIALSA